MKLSGKFFQLVIYIFLSSSLCTENVENMFARNKHDVFLALAWSLKLKKKSKCLLTPYAPLDHK